MILVTTMADCFSQQIFIGAKTVQRRRIQMVIAHIEYGIERIDSLRLIAGLIGLRQPHTTVSNAVNFAASNRERFHHQSQ